jgi:hypothetical protein
MVYVLLLHSVRRFEAAGHSCVTTHSSHPVLRNTLQDTSELQNNEVPRVYFPQRPGNKVTLYHDAVCTPGPVPGITLANGGLYSESSCWDDIYVAVQQAERYVNNSTAACRVFACVISCCASHNAAEITYGSPTTLVLLCKIGHLMTGRLMECCHDVAAAGSSGSRAGLCGLRRCCSALLPAPPTAPASGSCWCRRPTREWR